MQLECNYLVCVSYYQIKKTVYISTSFYYYKLNTFVFVVIVYYYISEVDLKNIKIKPD